MEMNEIILNASEWAGVIAVTLLLTLSRRFTVRPVAFKYQQREVILSGILALILIIASIYANCFLHLPTLPDGIKTGTAPDAPRQYLWAIAILLPVVLLLLVRRQPLLSVGLSRPTLKPAALLGLALVLITIFLRGKIYGILDGVTALEFNHLILSLVIALAGEIIFRGYLQLRLSAWLGRTAGWLVTSLLYFLFCVPFVWQASGGMFVDFWLPALIQLVQAVLLGWVMRRSGNILAGGMYQAAHFWVGIL
jgi:membrane protease YdiL (CAAX protease family)